MLKMRGKFLKHCKWAYSSKLRRFVCNSIPVTTKSPVLAISGCYTVGGANPNKPCMFPFFWNGKTFNGKLYIFFLSA